MNHNFTNNAEEFDIKLKAMYQQRIEPDRVLEKDTICRMKKMYNKTEDSIHAGQKGTHMKNRKWLKPTLAVMGAVLVVGTAGTAYAAKTGASIRNLFAGGMNRYTYSDKASDYECEILSYEVCDEIGTGADGKVIKAGNNLEITPIQINSDGFHNYVIAKVTGANGVTLTDNMHFDGADLELQTDNEGDYYHLSGSSSGETVLKYDEKEHAVYYAFTETGTNLKEGQEVTFCIGGWDWWDTDEESGEEVLHKELYKSYITTKIKKAEYTMLSDDALGTNGAVRLSAMGVCISTDWGEAGNNSFFEKNLAGDLEDTEHKVYVELKDGSKVAGITHGAAFDTEMYVCVTFEEIVPLSDVASVHVGDVVIDMK